MQRIIIHAGFHNTGTAHLQQTLRANRDALKPDVRLVLKPGMKALCDSARAYSRSREDVDLGMVKFEAASLMEQLSTEDAACIVLSSDNLCGYMPGLRKLHGYGAAPHLMRALSVAFGMAAPAAELSFLFTTRAADPWLRACYTQHLRKGRMVWDEADYLKRLASSADHDAVLDLIRCEIPDHSLHQARLEDYEGKPLGIATALLDLLDLPAARCAQLQPVKRSERAVSDKLNAQLLTLNRSDLDAAALRKAKRTLIKRAT